MFDGERRMMPQRRAEAAFYDERWVQEAAQVKRGVLSKILTRNKTLEDFDPGKLPTSKEMRKMATTPDDFMFANALRDYDAYIQSNPSNANAYYWRGLAKSNTGDYDGALLDYNSSINLNPGLPGAYYELSRVYYSKKDFVKALQYAVSARSHGYGVEDAYMKELTATVPH